MTFTYPRPCCCLVSRATVASMPFQASENIFKVIKSLLFLPFFFSTPCASINQQRIFLLIFLCASFAHKSRHAAQCNDLNWELSQLKESECGGEEVCKSWTTSERWEWKIIEFEFYVFHTQLGRGGGCEEMDGGEPRKLQSSLEMLVECDVERKSRGKPWK